MMVNYAGLSQCVRQSASSSPTWFFSNMFFWWYCQGLEYWRRWESCFLGTIAMAEVISSCYQIHTGISGLYHKLLQLIAMEQVGMILFFESEYTLKQKSILSGVFFCFCSLTPVKTYERVLELKKVNNFFHALCSCKCMHFCNISFLGTSTLFERNVYSKVRRITLHFFPFFTHSI